MAAAGLGSSHWWGFSPALDLAAVYDGKMLKMTIHSTVADVPCCTFVSVTLLFQYVDAAKNAGKEAKLCGDDSGAVCSFKCILYNLLPVRSTV